MIMFVLQIFLLMADWDNVDQTNNSIPHRFKFLTTRCIEKVLRAVFHLPVLRTGSQNIAPAIEIPIGSIITTFQRFPVDLLRCEYDVSRIVLIPVIRQNAPLRLHFTMKPGAGVWRCNMKGGSGDALPNGPVDGTC